MRHIEDHLGEKVKILLCQPLFMGSFISDSFILPQIVIVAKLQSILKMISWRSHSVYIPSMRFRNSELKYCANMPHYFPSRYMKILFSFFLFFLMLIFNLALLLAVQKLCSASVAFISFHSSETPLNACIAPLWENKTKTKEVCPSHTSM